MSPETSTETPPLWGDSDAEKRHYGEGATETAVRLAIESIHAITPLDLAQQARAQICLSLAKNIDAGNVKGRAVANEAQQLDAMLESLRGTADHDDVEGGIPEDVRQLFELGSVATGHDTTEVRDPA